MQRESFIKIQTNWIDYTTISLRIRYCFSEIRNRTSQTLDPLIYRASINRSGLAEVINIQSALLEMTTKISFRVCPRRAGVHLSPLRIGIFQTDSDHLWNTDGHTHRLLYANKEYMCIDRNYLSARLFSTVRSRKLTFSLTGAVLVPAEYYPPTVFSSCTTCRLLIFKCARNMSPMLLACEQ